METHDVLADNVHVCRPILLVEFAAVAVGVVAESRDIVGERVQPDVYDMPRVALYGYAPRERSTAYAKVLKSRLEKIVDHLVFTRYGHDELGMLVVILHEFVCVFAHPEEICLFFSELYLSAAVGTFAVHELTFRPEGFARGAIPALVLAFVYISLFEKSFEYLLHLLLVIRVGGADKFVVTRIHQIPDAFDLRRRLVDVSLRRRTCRLCLLLNFFSVLVRTRL